MELFSKQLPVWVVVTFIIVFGAEGEDRKRYKEQYGVEGSSYKMKCPEILEGSPGSYFTIWTVDGKPPGGPKYRVLHDGLVIRNLTKSDSSRNYTCTALDPHSFLPLGAEGVTLKLRQRSGKSLESSSKTPKPDVVEVWGILNQWKKLSCRMHSRPSPTFTWRTGSSGEPLQSQPDLYKIVTDESSSNLTVFLRNQSFFRDYTCVASNSLGESKQTFKLLPGYKPGAPFLVPKVIARDKVTVTVKNDEGHKPTPALPLTTYFVQFGKADKFKNSLYEIGARFGTGTESGSKKWITVIKTVEPTGNKEPRDTSETFELRNLEGNTTYLVRAAVGNLAAIGDFSSPIRVTTSAKGEYSAPAPSSPSPNKSRQQFGRAGLGQSENESDQLTPGHNNKINHDNNNNNDANAFINDKDNADAKGDSSGSCPHPKFLQTVITVRTETTLVELLDPAGGAPTPNHSNNGSLVNKRVLEETSIRRKKLCAEDLDFNNENNNEIY